MSVTRAIARGYTLPAPAAPEWKVEWYAADRWYGRLFAATEDYRAWGWYNAKCRVCSDVAIWRRVNGEWRLSGVQSMP